MDAFKAVSLFHPVKVTNINLDASKVTELKAFPFLTNSVPDLQQELPAYLAADYYYKIAHQVTCAT